MFYIIIIRAHNEQDNIRYVIEKLYSNSLPLAVLDSASTDKTSEYAASLHVQVVKAPLGLGAATVHGLTFFKNFPILFIDGDLTYIDTSAVSVLHSAAENGFVGKGVFDKPGRSSSVLKDLAKECGVTLPEVPAQALTSAYSAYPPFFADKVDLSRVPLSRGSDLTLSLLACKEGIDTVLVPIGKRLHNTKRGESHISNLIESNRKALLNWAKIS